MTEHASPSPFRRFPWVQLAFCAACLAMAAYTWMRCSYAWDLGYGDLCDRIWLKGEDEWPMSAFVAAHHVPVRDASAFAGEESGVRHDEATFLRLNLGEQFDVIVLPTQAWGQPGMARPEVIRGPLYGRVLKGTRRRGRAGIVMLDTTASRFHPTSVAGLVVGAMGAFVFGLYLRRWIVGRRAAA